MGTSIIVSLVLTLLIPSSISQCTKEKALPFFKRSVYEFSIDLVRRIALENENHFVSSSLSSWTLLSALSLGASDETLEEINEILRLHPHKCFNSKFFEIIQQLTHNEDKAADNKVKFVRSSSIYADNNLPVNEDFKSKIEKTKVSKVQQLSFQDPNTASTINSYVSDATSGNIDDIVEPSDLDGVYVVLIDALYFKAPWLSPFEEAELSAFYDENSNQIGDVNLCFGEINANLTNVNQIGATVLEIPYANDRFSMLFILPDEGQTISSVLDKLKRISLGTIFTLFSQTGSQRVLVQIPRFKINSDLDNMKEWLVDMGLRTVFDSNLASFTELSDYKLFVSNFIQKATIEVTEEGTEASVATAGFMEGRSLQIATDQFTANKPFLFMIVERELELALFVGAYSKPSAY